MSDLLGMIQQVKEDKQRHKAWNSLYWVLGEGFIQRSKAQYHQIDAVDDNNCVIRILGEDFTVRDDGMISFRGRTIRSLFDLEQILKEPYDAADL